MVTKPKCENCRCILPKHQWWCGRKIFAGPSCEEIQKYLKEKYNLGTFNLSLPFHYMPKDED